MNHHKINLTSFFSILFSFFLGYAKHPADVGQISKSLQKTPVIFETTSAPIQGEKYPSDAQESEKIPHKVERIVLEGNTVFSERELSPLYKDKIGKAVTSRELHHIVEGITEKYVKEGYVLSRALLPKQDISSGRVTIKIIEGYVHNISIEDPEHHLNDRVKRLLDRIIDSKPLHRDTLEKNIILIQRLPGTEVEWFFKPSQTHKNASDLVVKFHKKKFQGSATINNSGSNAIGPWRANLQERINNLTNHDDSLEVSAVTTENTTDLRAGFLTYTLPVGMDGLKVILSGNALKAKPSGPLESQAIRSKGNGMQLSLDYPLLLERDQIVTAAAGLSFVNSISDSPRAVSYYRDKFRSLLASVNYELSDSYRGSTLAQLAFEYGVKGLGSTSTPGINRSTARGTANFLTTNLTLSRVQDLEKWIPRTSLFFILQGQLSNATLLSSKQFGIGGSPYNRAYSSYAISGDSGFQGRLEMRYTDDLGSDFFKKYMLYGYYSYGHLWSRSPASGEAGKAIAQGVGVGVSFTLHNAASWYVEYGRPLKDKVDGTSNKDKWYTGISYHF